MRRRGLSTVEKTEILLTPMDLRRLARVPYARVISWLTVGHSRAGILPSIDLAETGKRHSFRIRQQDWQTFVLKLQTTPMERQRARPRPSTVSNSTNGMFRY
jgi:hypothetical protein